MKIKKIKPEYISPNLHSQIPRKINPAYIGPGFFVKIVQNKSIEFLEVGCPGNTKPSS